MMRFWITLVLIAIGFVFHPLILKAQAPVMLPVEMLPEKRIDVDLSEQRLQYFFGDIQVASILISSAARGYRTPLGSFTIQKKLPFVDYIGRNAGGTTYSYPHTKWNLNFLPRFYIHGAYWHNAFGTPRSHGCINVSYQDMEQLYNFADVGTLVTIHE